MQKERINFLHLLNERIRGTKEMIIMSIEEWKTKSEAWKESFRDWSLAKDIGMTTEERAKRLLDWEEGFKYAAAHFADEARSMSCDNENN